MTIPTLVNCIHAQPLPNGKAAGVQCILGLNGGRPSLGVCRRCDKRQPIDPDRPAVLVEVAVVKRMPPPVVMTPEQHRAAVEAAEKAMAVPRDQWPLAVKVLAALAGPLDKGIGDIVERKLGIVGEAWKSAYETLVGTPCGCGDRKRKLNLLYPLDAAKP